MIFNSIVQILDLLEGRPIYTLSIHKGAATCAAFSPSGKLLASAGADKQVAVWKIDSEAQMTPLSAARAPKNALSPRSPLTFVRTEINLNIHVNDFIYLCRHPHRLRPRILHQLTLRKSRSWKPVCKNLNCCCKCPQRHAKATVKTLTL